MVASSRCAGPRPKMPGERACFAFLGQSAAGRRVTAEDELKQPSGSDHSSTLALRKTLSWMSVTPSCMSLNAWLVASGTTSEVVWRQFNLLTGRRLWLSCYDVGSCGRCTVKHGVTVVQSGSVYTASHCLSQVVEECAHDVYVWCESVNTATIKITSWLSNMEHNVPCSTVMRLFSSNAV